MNDKEQKFNDYFISLINNYHKIELIANELTDEDIKEIAKYASFDEKDLFKEDKRNTVYLYALNLLYLEHKDSDILFEFLHCLNPFIDKA